jgi:hypothetical protein
VPSDEELLEVKERAAQQLLRLPGVTGVGLGGRERGGQPTGEVVLKVFVREKRNRDELAPGEIVPSEFEGVPTDVVVMGDAELDQAPPPPPGKPTVPSRLFDRDRHRPLVGGCQLHVDLSGPRSGPGTLGCFLIDPADATKVYALTAWHVLDATNQHPTVGTTKTGQPTKKDSSTKCCSHIIGKVAGGAKDPLRDAGIVRLDTGMEWVADILEIGAVHGTHTITVAEAATLSYQVRKRGKSSRLAGGTVQAINVTRTVAGVTHTNVTVVRPNPDPTLPAGTQVFFSQPGDSGAGVVNASNDVVGVHFARARTGTLAGLSLSTPIAAVLSQFQAVEGLTLTVATATTPGTVHVVPGAPMVAAPPEVVTALHPGGDLASEPIRAPIGSWLPGLSPPAPATLAAMQRDLDRSAAGRLLISTWLEHQDELIGLVNGNPRVATVWHRSGAAALFQYAVRMLTQPSLAMPETLGGKPLPQCMDRLEAVLSRFGSAPLRRDLDRVRAMLPDLRGLTYPQIMAALSDR